MLGTFGGTCLRLSVPICSTKHKLVALLLLASLRAIVIPRLTALPTAHQLTMDETS